MCQIFEKSSQVCALTPTAIFLTVDKLGHEIHFNLIKSESSHKQAFNFYDCTILNVLFFNLTFLIFSFIYNVKEF